MASVTAVGWAAYASLAAAVIGGGVSAYSSIQTGKATAAAAHFNADIQKRNAAIDAKNAEIAEQAGEAATQAQLLKTRNVIGATMAEQSASGLDVNSESFEDIRTSERALGEQDALTVRANAAREAYGYRVKSVSDEQQGMLSDFEAENAKRTGALNATSTLLSTASSAAGTYGTYKLKGGFSAS